MANEITVTSSTDDEGAIRQALGEKVEAKVPAKADKAAAEEPADDAEVVEEPVEEVEEPAEEADAEAEAEVAPKPKAKARDFAQERIDRMTWEKNNLLNELAKRDAEIANLRNPKAAAAEEVQEPEVPKFSKPEPKLDAAESIDKWMTDHANWAAEKARFEVAQEYEARETKRTKETAQTRQQREQEEVMAVHESRLVTFREEHPDFDEVAQEAIENQVPITPIMLSHVTQSEFGPALLYHLGKNPDMARKLAKMNMGPCLIALGKLEAKLEAEGATPIAVGGGEATPAPKRPRPVAEARRTNEPKTTPVTPVRGGAKTTKSPGEMSMAEYKAWRASGGGRR